MRERLLVGFIGIPVLVGAIWDGFPYFTLLIGVSALCGLWEFYKLTTSIGVRVFAPLGILWTVLFVANGQLTAQEGNFTLFLIGGLLLTTFVSASIHSRFSHGSIWLNWLFTAAGPLYVGLLLSHALMLREGGNGLYNGRDWLIYATFVTFATDSGALFFGTAIGRHRLVPTISPGKTWEGAIAGLICAIVASILLVQVLTLQVSIWHQILFGLLLGVAAQVGDLVESNLKRLAGVKDTSSLIPGHGGILDRIDSLVVTIPVTYYVLAIII